LNVGIMKIRVMLITGALALLTGCGSATDSVTFQPPPAFHAKASFGPFMQLWEGPPHTVMMLMSLPVAMDLNKAMSQADLKDATVQKTERMKICGGSQDAIYAEVEGEAKTDGSSDSPLGRRSEIEFLATNVKGKTYMALYARPLHSAADPAAAAALKNVCPK
jgi:hypothetical protein